MIMNLIFKKKKIACSFNDFSNNQFNKFLKELNKKNEITLFTSEKIAKKIFKNNFKIFFLDSDKNYLYNFLKKFSKTKKSSLQDYYFIEKIIFSNLLKKFFYLTKFILNKLGILIDINYLRRILIKKKIFKKKFDFLITDFRSNDIYSNHQVINNAKKLKIPIVVILFSWDNLYSQDVNLDADIFFVGSIKLRELLSERHKISLDKIFTFKSFQFSYLDKKVKKEKTDDYILYSCCVEQESEIAKEEIKIINYIADFLLKHNYKTKLYVRPYPFLKNKNNLNLKFNYPNIFVKEYGKKIIRRKINNINEFMRYEMSSDSKLKILKNAICNINFLSTIGLESVLLKKNTIFLNIKKKVNNANVIEFFKSNYFKSRFLDHYRIFEKNKFFVTDMKKLERKLFKVLDQRGKKYNIRQYKFIKNFFLKQ